MQKLEHKYHLIRRSSKTEISKVQSLNDKWEIYRKLQSPPQNRAHTGLHQRCFVIGRPRANYRDFGLSGHILQGNGSCMLVAWSNKIQLVKINL